ncbi:hypothetical protein Q8A67_015996 [Cirrhinus molitorella]|uniref:Nucleoporin NUP42 n=1 Tax=Cirrhinus molitorella TaxID=172907 RepID=A0AA88PFU1_9TELE|nr:hypothetical protein Q8A67_015996 [Cirrhinus molitorella]
MPVCNFFLQGRCRYGEKCWNEHPRGGRGGDFRGNQQPSRGGFGNRVWINPSQRTSGDYIQPSSFSHSGNNDWSRGGGGGGGTSQDIKSSDFSFSSQNRFSALSSHSHSDKGGQNTADDNAKHVDTIQKDMEIWQTSGQWPFSCYSALNGQISGFVELSPEELRLEYYTGQASGDLQTYMNSVQQLANQWRSRVQELRTMSSSTQISVISELNNPSSSTSTQGFVSTSSGFSSTASGFGNTSSSSSGIGVGGFVSSAPQSSSSFSFASSKAVFGESNTQQAPGAFAQPSSGFAASAPSVASFSFAPQATENKASAAAFNSASAFSFKSSSGGLGTGFSSSAPTNSGFNQSSAFASSAFSGATDASHSAGSLFSAQSDLTADELKEFTAKRFTLGQIPLKPPPAELLTV